jgi:Domain of unknown function (DUF4126)
VHLVFDILQGMGIAAAVGIRPFLPALAVCGLAAGDIQIDFNRTSYSYLESAPFVFGLVVASIALLLIERQLRGDLERGPWAAVLGVVSLGIAALLFAGALSQDHYETWPGYIAGAACAALAFAATRPLLIRVRARLGDEAAAVPLYAEGTAIALAALSVLAPPVGLVGILLLLWLLLAARRREDQKYAGLRILR